MQSQQPSTQETISPVVPSPEPTKSFGWFKWILIVGIVALLSSGATYFLVQSQSAKQTPKPIVQTPPTPSPIDETANWKTYTNTKYGYLVKYPPELYVDDLGCGNKGGCVLFSFEDFTKFEIIPSDVISIYYLDKDHTVEFDTLFKAAPGEQPREDPHVMLVTKIRNFKMMNYDTVEFTNSEIIGDVSYQHIILIKKNGREFFRLTNQSLVTEDAKKRDKIFDQILSTFKFLE